MSMMGEFREMSEAALSRLTEKPALIDSVVLAHLPMDDAIPRFEAFLQSLPTNQRDMMRGLHASMTPEQRSEMERLAAQAVSSLQAMRAEVKPRAGGDTIPPDQLGERLSIDKAWHGVHYLLCGTVDEASGVLGRTILGGTPVGPDLGYGPARYLTANDVRELAAALAQITRDALLERYVPDTMERLKIYPGHWEDPENRDWLAEAFAQVVEFYTNVAARGNAVLLYLS